MGGVRDRPAARMGNPRAGGPCGAVQSQLHTTTDRNRTRPVRREPHNGAGIGEVRGMTAHGHDGGTRGKATRGRTMLVESEGLRAMPAVLATLLACEKAKLTDETICVIDLTDDHCGFTNRILKDDGHGLMDLLSSDAIDDDKVSAAIRPADGLGIGMLPAPSSSTSSRFLDEVDPARYVRIIESARNLYDIVVIAAYMGTGEDRLAISSAADKRMLVMTPNINYTGALARYATRPDAYGIDDATELVALRLGAVDDVRDLVRAARITLPGKPCTVLRIDDGDAIIRSIYEHRFAESLSWALLERFHELADRIQ